jgi:hypothetical protein
MDQLDGVLSTVVPLLKRVDEVLSSTGAPRDHQVWPALRRVRLLPWDAVQAVAALRPGELAGASAALRADARSYGGVAASLPGPGSWSGEAADAYDAARRRAAAHLSGGLDSLDERLEATADLADALTDWIRRTRSELAATLAEVMLSAEALSLTEAGSPPGDPVTAGQGRAAGPVALGSVALGSVGIGEARAAADVAARVLEAVAGSYDAALELIAGSADLTTARHM